MYPYQMRLVRISECWVLFPQGFAQRVFVQDALAEEVFPHERRTSAKLLNI
jgi:hypothetical protein